MKINIVKNAFSLSEEESKKFLRRIRTCLSSDVLFSSEESILSSYFTFITERKMFTEKQRETLDSIERQIANREDTAFNSVNDDDFPW